MVNDLNKLLLRFNCHSCTTPYIFKVVLVGCQGNRIFILLAKNLHSSNITTNYFITIALYLEVCSRLNF